MKKAALLLTAVLLLSGCGDTSNIDKIIEENEKPKESEVTLSPADEAIKKIAEDTVNEQQSALTTQPPSNKIDESRLKNGDIDLDLTELNPTMLYSELFEITGSPENYKDMTIRVNGIFDYNDNNGTDQFAVFIKDATACCASGLLFRTAEELNYPDDYPAIGTPITVTGRFNYYKDGIYVYCELTDATFEITEEN